MQALAIDDFAGLMREWAEWFNSLEALGFSDSTTIWRAAMGSQDGEFQSTIPAGIRLLETHGALKRLITAMNELLADHDTKEPVLCVQWAYLYGVEKGVETLGKSRAKYYQMLQTGETLIRREIKRH